MTEPWLYVWQQAPLLTAWLIAIGFHLFIYLFWGCGIAAFYRLLRQLGAGAILDRRPLFPAQLRREILRGLANCLVVSLVTLACVKHAAAIWPSSAWLVPVQVLSLILFYDLAWYFIHRLLHLPPLLRLHGVHHRSVRTTPWSGLSVHPVEAVLIELPVLVFMLATPFGIGPMVIFQFTLHYGSSVGHGNFDPFARLEGVAGLKRFMRIHQLHHARGNVNFAAFFPHWDRLFGTYGNVGAGELGDGGRSPG
jgi:sterol desaturase/sphingolipid hydroxylase (fatty acid hydroxylase superfamily)